ncbi:MAG: hypothetical protein A2Y10_20145 [Planctomycetes bacterium GWF2_41_51]|nr:MAG: hypothetical protein A2Y10_20145 [Planctomycetes bacterium GWF2_41_51]HBG27012.1 hypothetical protein [Phycisphaerales bacterium]
MYTCPNCQTDLKRVRSKFGLFWICPSCKGRAITIEVIRKVISRSIVNKLWQRTITGEFLQKRNCPSCTLPMSEIPLAANEHTTYLDVCPKCHIIWFDDSEYQQLPKIPVEKNSEKEMSLKARQALAIAEVQMMGERRQENMPLEDIDDLPLMLPAMFGLPIKDYDEGLESYPVATWILAGIITVIGIIGIMSHWKMINFIDYKDMVKFWGLIPAECSRCHGLTSVTSFFLNSNYLIFAGNLYFLLIFGENVEDVLGKWRYLLLIFCAALIGAVLHVISNKYSTIPYVGANAGITGIIAYYALRFPKSQVRFLFRFGGHIHWFTQPAIMAFLGWVVLQFILAYKQIHGLNDAKAISSIANVGGAAVGLIFWILTRSKISETNQTS